MDSLGISASGMRIAALRLDAAASNVARLPVEGAQRIGVSAAATPGGGVAGTRVVAAPDASAPVGDLLEGRQAALTFDANARMLKAGDDSLGFLLDVLA